MSANVNFTWGNLPDSYCFSTLESYKNDIFNLLSGTVDVTGIVIGPNTPDVSDEDKVWVKTDAAGRPVGIFLFLGSWIWPNSREPSGNERMIWSGAEADLWAYDGGDGTDPSGFAPTLTTGAMWQVDTAFAFRIPIGAGTSPNTYDGNPATVINQGDTLGDERVLLADAEISHRHVTGRFQSDATSYTFFLVDNTITASGSADRNPGADGTSTPGAKINQDLAAQAGDYAVTSEILGSTVTRLSHQNLPPVIGVFYAKRTARKFYVG